MSRDSSPPQILQYLEYRDFLKDYCDWRRRSDREFSQRTFAKEAGLPASSSSLLPAVLKGRRQLSQNLRVKFAKALQLPERQARYFDLLVQFNQAKGMAEKNHFFSLLSQFRSSRAQILGKEQFEFYSKWYYSAVRNFFAMETRLRHPEAIAARLFPEVTSAQVEEAIRLLLDLGLIRKTANGYAVTERHIFSPKDVQAKAARGHMLELTRMSLEVLERVPPTARQYNALMFTTSPKGFAAVKERMRSFVEELREIVDRDTGEDRVYSLTMQLFPNTRLPEVPERGS